MGLPKKHVLKSMMENVLPIITAFMMMKIREVSFRPSGIKQRFGPRHLRNLIARQETELLSLHQMKKIHLKKRR